MYRAAPGDRRIIAPRAKKADVLDRAIDLLDSGSVVAVTLATPPEGAPMEVDEDLAALAIRVVERVLDRGAEAVIADDDRPGERRRKLVPADIGISATHRSMNAAIQRLLPSRLRDVRVDTPERWQGLERRVFVAVHPLSGVIKPAAFDLETGRLCVMASRHKAGLVVVTRDHVGDTLDNLITTADQAVGRPDVSGRGHFQHRSFWAQIANSGRIVAAT